MESISRNYPISTIILSVGKCIHDHSKGVKISRIAIEALGITLIASSFVAFEAISLPLLASGFLIILITEIAYQTLKFFGFIAIDRSNHVFKPEREGKSKLYYIGNLPILETTQEDPLLAGREHGYLMAPHIFKLLSRHKLCAYLFNLFHRADVPNQLEELKKHISEDHLKELEGVAQGMNRWDQETNKSRPTPITADTLLEFHSIADSAHFTLSNLPPLGCTVIAYKNIVGRVLDWPTLGIYADYTLLIHRITKNHQTLSVSFPGLVGDLTAINDKGEFAAMNVCSPKERTDCIKYFGTLSPFIVRQTIENSPITSDPLVPLHLTVVKQGKISVTHYLQGKHRETFSREMEEDKPLVTLNNYHASPTEETHVLFLGEPRKIVIDSHFATSTEPDHFKVVQGACREPFVDNPLSCYCVILNIETGKLHISFDNGFAASSEPETLYLPDFFAVK